MDMRRATALTLFLFPSLLIMVADAAPAPRLRISFTCLYYRGEAAQRLDRLPYRYWSIWFPIMLVPSSHIPCCVSTALGMDRGTPCTVLSSSLVWAYICLTLLFNPCLYLFDRLSRPRTRHHMCTRYWRLAWAIWAVLGR